MAQKKKGNGGESTEARLRRELAASRLREVESRAREAASAAILKVIRRSPNDVQAVFDAIVKSARKLLDGHSAVMLRLEGDMLHLLALTSTSKAVDRIARGRYPMPVAKNYTHGMTIRTRRPHVTPDTEKYPAQWRAAKMHARLRGHRSVVGVPMLLDGKPIGSISVTRVRPGDFDRHEIRMLEALADQAGIAIENARLFNETKEALERQTATAEILKVMASSPSDVQPVFDAIAANACRLLGGRQSVVSRRIDDTLHLAAYTTTGDVGDAMLQRLFPTKIVGRGAMGRAILTKLPAVIEDYESEPGLSAEFRKAARARKNRSVLAVPMLWESEATGSISVTRSVPGPFSEHETELLKTFADQAVLAIENVRLFNETKEALERQTATAEILKVISGSPADIQPVLRAVAESAARLCAASNVHIRLVDGEFMPVVVRIGEIAIAPQAEAQRISRRSAAGRAILERRTIHIEDVTHPSVRDEYPDAAFLQQSIEFRALLAVPMLRDGAAIGTITVRRAEVKPFSEQHIKLLQTFADQAVIAIENVRLFNETKESLERQTATAEILKVIASSPSDVQPVFDAIVRNSQRLVGGNSCSVTRVQDGHLHLMAYTSTDPATDQAYRALYPEPIGQREVVRQAVRTGRPQTISNVPAKLSAARNPAAPDVIRARNVGSILLVPLLREGTTIGLIHVARAETSDFTPHQVKLIETFADQAVIAIENVRLFNETKEALERQTATAEILKVIASSPANVQPVFDAIAASAKRLLSAGAASVARRAGDMLHLAAFTSQGEAADAALQKLWPTKILGQGHMGQAVLSRSPILISDIETEPGYSEGFRAMARTRRLRSVVSVPMLREGEAIGVISVNRPTPGNFSEHQTNLLKTFADQAVIAIENVRLFNETKEALERQTATAEILKAIANSPTDVQPVFDAIVNSCLHLFQGSRVALGLARDGQMETRAVADAVNKNLAAQAPFAIDRASAAGVAILENRMIVVPDTEVGARQFARMKELSLRRGYRSVVVVPLARGGSAFGMIAVSRPVTGAFTDGETALLRTFADQAVIAIENVRLFNETKEALERQTATAEILKVIASSPSDVQPVFDAIAASARRLLGGHAANVARRAGDVLELAAFTSTGEAGDLELSRLWPSKITGKGPMGKALLSAAPAWVEDIEADLSFSEEFRVGARARGMRSAVCVPMLREGEAIGVIAVNRSIPGRFSDHQTNLLKTFADQAVIAIENVRLFNETKDALERQTATAEILNVIAGSPANVQPVFDAIVQSAARLFDRKAALRLVEPNGLRRQAWSYTIGDEFHGAELLPVDRDSLVGRAVLECKALQFADSHGPDAPPYARAHADELTYRAVATAPLVRDGAAIGVITVTSEKPGALPDKQLALLKTFADQAVIAIENVRLFNETKEALERQTATAEILKVIASSPDDVQPVFDAIAASALRLCAGSFSVVTRFDGRQIHLEALCNAVPEAEAAIRSVYPIVPNRSNATARAVEEREAVQIPDVLADPAYQVGDVSQVAKYRSVLAVPMLRDGTPVGAINVCRAQAGQFPEHQISLLRTFADQAVIAIENVRLFNETKEALERQTATSEVLRVISSSPTDVQPVFDSIAESAATLCGAKIGFVAKFDGALIHMMAHYGTTPEAVDSIRAAYPMKPEGESVAARVIRNGAPVQVADVLADATYSHKDAAVSAGFRSALGVPLLRENQIVGAIIVVREVAGDFEEKQIDLLKTFADQAVIAIENVRLFNETKEALERQTATAEILKVISESPTNTKPVFDAIVQSGRGLFPNAAVAVMLPEGNQVRMAAVAAQSSEQAKAWRGRFPIPMSPDRMHAKAILDCELIDVPDAEAAREGPYAPGIENFLKSGNRAITIAPMVCEGTAIGAISVVREKPGPLSEKQVALLRTFAAQAVIAIENVRLFNETKESLERQTATAEILRVIASSPSDVQPVFDAIVKSAVRLIGGFSAVAVRVEGGMLHLAAITSTSPEGDDALRGIFPQAVTAATTGNVHRAVQTGMPAVRRDMETDPDVSSELRGTARARGWRSAIAVPMMREGKAVGAINVTRVEAGDFSPHEIDLLQTFADQAVIAIENVRLFNETKEALERQTATADVLKVISSSHSDLRPVFDVVLKSATTLCDAHLGILNLYDGEKFETGAQCGGNPEFVRWLVERGPWAPAPSSSVARMIAERRPVQIRDMREDPGYRKGAPITVKMVDLGGARTFLTVPLLRDGKVLGNIGIYRPEVREFTDRQIALVGAFADQAVIAIENVRLFKELQSRTEALTKSVGQLTALGEVGQAISSTLEVETVLETIVQHAVKLTGLDGGSIYEYDEGTEAFSLQASENIEPELVEAVRTSPVRKGEGAIGRCAETLEPAQVADIMDASYHSGRKDILVRAGYRAVLAVPLVREGHLLGALQVFRKAPGEFAPEIVELLKTFATQSAMAIQNARLFREIAAKGKQLEEASRHKSNFLASMSHELRTPLNAILGFNEMILGQVYGEVPADMQEPLADIQTSGKHLLRLINNVLDLAKIEAGRMELALSDYSVQDTVESVRSTLRPLAAEKGLEFLASVPNDLPLAYGDGGRIAQCLMNLAGNSLKFTKAGRVEISVQTNNGLLVYKVADTGIGIPPEKIGSLFTEFKQTDATIASEYGGTGLGLSISRKFVEMHGGRIWVESELGKGSAFIFEIPLRVQA
jgi:GAF domain-containing protein